MSKNSYRIKTVGELDKCCHQLNRLLGSPVGTQFIDALDDEIYAGSNSLVILREGIIHDFDIIEQFIKIEYDSPTTLYCLETSKDEEAKRQLKFPSWREAGLRVALHHGIKEKINLSSPKEVNAFLFDSIISNDVDMMVSEILQTANVKAWKKIDHANERLYEIKHDIYYIKKFRTRQCNCADLRRLKHAIQNVSMEFAHKLATVLSLSIQVIEGITYIYSHNIEPKKRAFIISINNLPIRFDGLRAENLNILFSDPYGEEEIDIDRFKFTKTVEKKAVASRNECLRKDFDDINRQMCKKFYQFGFIYGYNELINSDKYLHRINPYFAPYINKSTEEY